MNLTKLGVLLVAFFVTNAMAQQIYISCQGEHVILSADKNSGFYILGSDSVGEAYKLNLKNKGEFFYEYSVARISTTLQIVGSEYKNFTINRNTLHIRYTSVAVMGGARSSMDRGGQNCRESGPELNGLLSSIKDRYAQDAAKERKQDEANKAGRKI
jgi:hypothetical protein